MELGVATDNNVEYFLIRAFFFLINFFSCEVF